MLPLRILLHSSSCWTKSVQIWSSFQFKVTFIAKPSFHQVYIKIIKFRCKYLLERTVVTSNSSCHFVITIAIWAVHFHLSWLLWNQKEKIIYHLCLYRWVPSLKKRFISILILLGFKFLLLNNTSHYLVYNKSKSYNKFIWKTYTCKYLQTNTHYLT